ncbi:MAG TPA: sulfotransferase, partial [Ktedonobacter sp.]|nr:sulfotransferase [Ktedonobacter sp.]
MKPNFFIIGAARSGTSSLDRYLSQHPEIYITPKKETHFFAHDLIPSNFTGPGDERLNNSLIRDEKQYAQLFADTTKKVVGESSAFYLCFPEVAERIAQAVPDAKIIVILREPVDRTYSAHTFLSRDGRETLSFEEG